MTIRNLSILAAFAAGAALLTPLVIRGQSGGEAPAQPAQPAKAPEAPAAPTESDYSATLEGTAYEIKLELRAYDGPVELVSVIEAGTEVDADETIAMFSGRELEDQIQRAEETIRRLTSLQNVSECQMTEFEVAKHVRAARTDESLRAATSALERYRASGMADAIRLAELEAIGIQDSLDDQREELAQLEELYKGNDLAKESQDIVVRRTKRRMDRLVERLGISQRSVERVKEQDIPARTRQLEIEQEQAVAASNLFDSEEARRQHEILARRSELDVAMAGAMLQLDNLLADRETLSALKAPAPGVFVHGTAKDNDGVTSSLRIHDRVQRNAVIGTVVDASRLRARVMRDQQFAPRAGKDYDAGIDDGESVSVTYQASTAQPVSAKIKRYSRLGKDGKVAVELAIENDGTLLPGAQVKVKFVKDGGK